MDHDAHFVTERIEVATRLLQSVRARDPAVPRPASIDRAIDLLASFPTRAVEEGWVAAFDAVLDALALARAHAVATHRREIEETAAYLLDAERAIVRLAAAGAGDALGKAEPRWESRWLVPSQGTPSLHPDAGLVRGVSRDALVEPNTLAQIQRSARDALEEVSSLSMLRRTGDSDPWTFGEDFERRLLEALDACAAYGRGRAALDVTGAAFDLARAFPIVDPTKWFSGFLLLACMRGERAMAELRHAILVAPEGTGRAAVDALALGSNPGLRGLCTSLLEEDDRPAALEVALAAADRLGLVDQGAMAALLEHPTANVARLSARCLARADAQTVAPHLVRALDRHDVAADAAWALSVLRVEAGQAAMRERLARGAREEPTDAADARRAAGVLALSGQKRDEEALLQAAMTDSAVIPMLADHGSPRFLPFLREEMGSSRDPLRSLAAAEALTRMTGVEIDPLDPSRPRRRPEEPLDDGQRRAFAARLAAADRPAGAPRIRAGRRLDVACALEELADPTTRQGIRRAAARALPLLVDGPIVLDVDGWVVAQRDALRVLRSRAGLAPSLGGA
ncbi:MAG: hypothetical protein U0414_24640 [Polyangiaceae bacterium]